MECTSCTLKPYCKLIINNHQASKCPTTLLRTSVSHKQTGHLTFISPPAAVQYSFRCYHIFTREDIKSIHVCFST